MHYDTIDYYLKKKKISISVMFKSSNLKLCYRGKKIFPKVFFIFERKLNCSMQTLTSLTV